MLLFDPDSHMLSGTGLYSAASVRMWPGSVGSIFALLFA
jgi:hypothetical protein